MLRSIFNNIALFGGIAAFLVLANGCGSSGPGQEFQQMINGCTNMFKASDVKRVCIPLLKKHERGGVIDDSDLPGEIKKLPLFADDPSDIRVTGAASDSGALLIFTGGGFGHWGLVICRSANDKTLAKVFGKHVIPWGDGVYFYRE